MVIPMTGHIGGMIFLNIMELVVETIPKLCLPFKENLSVKNLHQGAILKALLMTDLGYRLASNLEAI